MSDVPRHTNASVNGELVVFVKKLLTNTMHRGESISTIALGVAHVCKCSKHWHSNTTTPGPLPSRSTDIGDN